MTARVRDKFLKVKPIKDQGITVAETEIYDSVWNGAKAIVLCGNIVGSGSVIGAGAIVTHSTKNTVNIGAPARAIKER